MKNVPELFDQILYKNLRPWLDTNKPDEKFFPMISVVENIYPSFQPLYEVDFYKPFNNKTKYYQKLILNEANKYCNVIIELINEDDNIQVQKYWLNDTLNKKLRTRLNDIGKLIKDNDYSLLYINPYKNTFNEDADHKTDTYIIQLLKNTLIKVYLEIQEVYSYVYSDNLLDEHEIYTQLLFEVIPDKSFLKDAPEIIVVNTKDAIPRNTKAQDFKPIMDDIRPVNNSITSYHHIIKRPQSFASFEEKLFMNDYIGLDYSFNDKHGYKNELAMIYHILIEKGYFNKFNDGTKKPTKPNEIRKFLDYRYNINLDKQFRTLANNQTDISTFKEKNSWLFNLPPC